MAAFTAIAAGVMAAAAVGSAVYSMTQEPPDIPPPPPPASYYSYDDEGNPAGEQVWDASKNAYVYKPAPMTEAQKAEKAKRQEIRTQMLGNLAETPEDRVKAYDDYARTFSDVMHKDVDTRYQDIVKSTDESMEARGMTGSRAYADTVAQLAQDKQATDVEIAEKAGLAKEQLSQQDKDYYLRVLAELDAGRNADYLNALQKQQASVNAAQMGTAGIMAGYNADSSNKLRKWELETERNRNLTDTFANTATGLAFLYGYNKPTGSLSPASSSSSAYSNAYLNYNRPSWL